MDADATEAASVAQRLMACLEEPFELGSLSASVSASIGVSLAPNDAYRERGSLLVRGRGDVPRQGGRKSRCVLRPGSRRRRPVEPCRGSPPGARGGSAGPALPAPIALQSDQIVAVEALVRWSHPKHGLVPPLKFIPLAEEAGLMGRLTEWVIDEALRQSASWLLQGNEVSVSVNISASTLLSSGFAGVVDELLRRHGVPARLLVARDNRNHGHLRFRRLQSCYRRSARARDRGVHRRLRGRLHSLAHLSGLSVRELKLDRVFIRDWLQAGGSVTSSWCVHSRAAHALGLRVVAERYRRCPDPGAAVQPGLRPGPGLFHK